LLLEELDLRSTTMVQLGDTAPDFTANTTEGLLII
jgi:hypothetical protein